MSGLKHQKEKRGMDHFAGQDVSVKETSVCIVDDTGHARQPHAPQHIGRLGELNIVVTNDLYSIAPGVPKIKEWTIKYGNTSRTFSRNVVRSYGEGRLTAHS